MTKSRLTREAIAAAALDLADQRGLDGLTVRRLAGRLGVTPMALYKHVDDKAAIVALLLDEVIRRELSLHYDGADPGPWLVDALVHIRGALVAHPAVLSTVGDPTSFGPGALQVGEQLLAALQAGGLEGRPAADALWILVSTTLGAAALASAADPSHSTPERWQALLEQLSPHLVELPHVLRAGPALIAFAGDARFRAGVEGLVASLPLRTPDGSGGSTPLW